MFLMFGVWEVVVIRFVGLGKMGGQEIDIDFLWETWLE